jgi:hypothetical protein
VSREAPSLDRFTHRLSECPAAFLAPPRVGGADGVHVEAIVHDVVIALGGAAPSRDQLAALAPPSARAARPLTLVLVACWLLHDEWFRAAGSLGPAAAAWLGGKTLPALAAVVTPERFVHDPDRREELVRLCLSALGLRPEGESEAQAEDRLRALNSIERARLIHDTREQQVRVRQLREEMQKKAAVEAAAKVSREW